MNKNFKVKCPGCDIVFLYYESNFRPFCSERCKMVDLGHWFNESYVVPLKEQVNDNEESSEDKIKENIEENIQENIQEEPEDPNAY